MVIPVSNPNARRRGALMTELLVAIALLTAALLPLAYSLVSERRTAKAYYLRAVAMEIVDGEMEALLAARPRPLETGTREFSVHANAATNLPPGKFLLTVSTNSLRLEWKPSVKDHGGPVTREVLLK